MIRRVLALSLATTAFAMGTQPLLAQNTALGIKGGVNIANVSSTDVELADTKTRTAFAGGAFVSVGFTDVVGLQLEGLFSPKGFSLAEQDSELTAAFDYFAIPLLLKFTIPIEESPVRPALYAGGSVSFESSCGVSGNLDGTPVDASCDGGQFDLEREKTDYGLIFGGEIQVDVGSVFLLLDGRYDLGLRDIDVDDSASTKSRTWSFMAGVGFNVN